MGTALCWNIALVVHAQNFEQKFCQDITVYVNADMDLQKCWRKSACFFIEKQKRKKTEENERKTDTE